MHLRLLVSALLVAACPADDGAPGGSDTAATAPGTSTGDDAPTATDSGGTPVECVAAGIGPAFAWATASAPGLAECSRISDSSLALDCHGGFTGIFTLELSNPVAPGIVTGEPLAVDYRNTMEGDSITAEWLQVRTQTQYYVVAGQGPTLAPPGAPADWFHPNVEVTLAATDCAAVPCGDGSGDESTPRAIAFGQGGSVVALAPGKDGGVPGEFGGERYHAAVSEAHTGLCGGGATGSATDLLAFSVVSSGLP